ncbi:dihydroorotase [Brumimicrobium aurantiacum]|uniref:Dihydroorotase n=1 Tax=Brumimicrobium aurantiacum TaxID=1737063 RepID=A0A3E1F0M9_9FLAO|nr:dihydroorotase [Brumimicrobium aurantiacum]RFC55382.1 dihydroorotase [Brumimicrobium aurantiacum]
MKYLLKQATIINEGTSTVSDVLIQNDRIEKIASTIEDGTAKEINCEGKYLVPGSIDDQVHFREPGLTHKGNIHSESRAAVAGGITSFMEMPNTVPNALTQELLADKYEIAANSSIANYSFFMGASNDNIEEVLKTNPKDVCGVKVFMGSSTGNMLVDEPTTLNKIFGEVPMLIATHCEDEGTVRRNMETYKAKFGEDVPIKYHPEIRSEEACYLSSSMAVELAKKHNARLHVLHISTAKELSLFENKTPLAEKRITAEACVHHLWFSEEDYAEKQTLIKWNPAVKKKTDREAIWQAVLDNRIDVLATDHAPHTIEEKNNTYFKAPSGGPLVQHALLALLEKSKQGVISKERVIEKTAHAPATLFGVENRGFIREGYFADLVIIDPNKTTTVSKDNILYNCGWSPFEGTTFNHQIEKTFVNGNMVYDNHKVIDQSNGRRLSFNRFD